MIGFLFCDELDADIFFDKIQNRGLSRRASVIPTSSQSSSNVLRRSNTGTIGRKRAIRREDISTPTNFRHISHIGWDPNRGFDVQNIPLNWKALFDKAGVTREQLEDKETAKFIIEFVQSQGGPPPLPNQQPENFKACTICCDNEATHAIVPCGHKCLCSECGPLIRDCPLCRTQCTQIIKIFEL